MKKRSILLVIVFFISIIILSVNNNNKYLVKEESLATYIDGEKTDSFPAKGTVAFAKAECDNNTNIYWDNDTWGLYATNLNEKTKCNLYFKTLENAVTKITNLASTDTVNMASDDPDNNIRYIGANPNNYVYFNCDDYNNQTSDTCELWRIIGVFNNIEKEDGTKENLIKIIREDSIGQYSWDYKSDGSASNDWTKSTLQQLLNNGAYYKGMSDFYYNDSITATKIDLNNSGFKNDETKNAIETVAWNLGSSSTYDDVNTEMFYSLERNTNSVSNVSTKWNGKIALIYPSDYGYSTSGRTKNNRNICIKENLYYWNNDSISYCKDNSYLYKRDNYQWTLTINSTNGTGAFNINAGGIISYDSVARHGYNVRPTLFLKSSISIGIGDGSSTNPYQLSL